MNRYSDIQPAKKQTLHHLDLPKIDYSKVGREGPEVVAMECPSSDKALPKADVAVITWTSAEWAALDHVFADYTEETSIYSHDFRDKWCQYSKNAPTLTDDWDSPPLWGYYRMVKIKGTNGKWQDVLLFKADAHLAHPLWIKALEEMVQNIIDDARPDRLYSIGTAGGSSLNECLGDTAITNSGHLSLQKKENLPCDYNEKTITGSWFPDMDLIRKSEDNLLFKMDKVVTKDILTTLIEELHSSDPASAALGYADLVNEPLTPSNLGAPKGLNKKDIPLLTTDYYFIASGEDADQYCTLEMDDTVVGKIAKDNDVKFVFFRNISDPIVADKDQKGQPISDDIRSAWSGLIYKNYGIYSSLNGALLTWATIASHTSS